MKPIRLAPAIVLSLFLVACSDGGGSSGGMSSDAGDGSGSGSGGGSMAGNDDPQVGNDNPGDEPPTGEPLLEGFFQGAYALDGDGEVAGLALAEDGSALSLFGPLGGDLRRHDHVASNPATQGNIFGTGEFAGTTGDFSLSESGQTLTDGDGMITLRESAAGGLMEATPTSVAGRWGGRHRFLFNGAELFFVTEVTFSGDTFSGQTRVENSEGENTRLDPITNGTSSRSGDALLVSFDWNGNRYDGIVFFTPDATGRLVFVGETTASGASNLTIASLLTMESN